MAFVNDKSNSFDTNVEEKYSTHKIGLTYNTILCLGKENGDIPYYVPEILSGMMTADQAIKEIKKQLKRTN